MDSYSYYFLFPKCQTNAYTMFENGCSENSTQKLLTKYSKEKKNKHIICRPRSVRVGKNCALGLEYSRPLAQVFPIRTDLGRQITYMHFCVCRFLLKNVFFTEIINIFVSFVFILVDAFDFPVSWFYKDREITKNLLTTAENNFEERKLSCTRLKFGEILFAGTKRVVPGGQYRSILPARVANQNTEFAAHCPLRGLAV